MQASAYAARQPSSSEQPTARAANDTSRCQAGASHWSTYWRDFGEGNARPERCHVPGDGRDTVDRHWQRLADVLPVAAKVIDLGCGAGTVGRTLLRRRPDLRVTGIDFAEVPVEVLPNLTLCPEVPMEALPFDDGSFDAAVSLFGIEYGCIAETARELGRVLRPDARFSFVIHHCDSEIAIEGRTRVNGIKDLLSDPVGAAFLAGDAALLEHQRLRLLGTYPGEPTVRLVSDYFRRSILQSRSERQAIWARLADDVAVEVALTTRMTECAKSSVDLGAWIAPLFAIMARVEVSVLGRRTGEPIGWAVSGTR